MPASLCRLSLPRYPRCSAAAPESSTDRYPIAQSQPQLCRHDMHAHGACMSKKRFTWQREWGLILKRELWLNELALPPEPFRMCSAPFGDSVAIVLNRHAESYAGGSVAATA